MRRLALLLSLLLFTTPALASESIKGGPTESGSGVVGASGGGAPVDTLWCSIPATLTGLSSGADLELVLDFSACVSTLDWFNGSTSDISNITIPAGITRLDIEVQLRWDGTATGTHAGNWLRIQMGLGESIVGFANGVVYRDVRNPTFGAGIPFNHRAVFDNVIVAPTNVLDIRHTHTTGGTIGIDGNVVTTWVKITGFAE